MKLELIDNNSDKLIIFLTGWGCDANQFSHLSAKKYDVLIAYNYNNLNFEFDFSKYSEINLLTFSAGVFISGVVKKKLPQLNKKVAVNGNPLSFDKYFGPPEHVVKTISTVSRENVIDFRRNYLVHDDKELSKFNKNQANSHRGLEDCLNEFKKIREYYKSEFDVMDFDLVLLSENDKIFDIKKQLQYYKNNKVKVLRNAAHYPFFKFNTYDEIFDGINSSKEYV